MSVRDGTGIWVQDEGPRDGPVVVFANSLGSDLTLWDAVLPHLPGYRTIRWDKRGHGRSDVPDPPYRMGRLVSDAEAVIAACGVTTCVFIGCSIGGMIAQGLAVKRGDLLRGMVLANTAAKIGTAQMWQDRIDTALTRGMAPMVDGIIARWFGRDFSAGPGLAHWRSRLAKVPPKGYAGCCAAIQGTDFYTPTSGLRLPTLALAGPEDGSTPPDLVRETADLIPGSQFALIPRTGHLPCVEAPAVFAGHLTAFLSGIGHMPGDGRAPN